LGVNTVHIELACIGLSELCLGGALLSAGVRHWW
jgi:hypothetical protein